MIDKDFDVPFVARLAQREKQIQQHYRPVIGVHKWFARRPGTLFRALLLPRGPGFVTYPEFQQAYEVLKRHTAGFTALKTFRSE
jgi:hypothetical protein